MSEAEEEKKPAPAKKPAAKTTASKAKTAGAKSTAAKPAAKAASKSAPKAGAKKPAAKSTTAKTSAKSTTNAAAKSASKPAAKSTAAKASAKSETKAAAKPAAKAGAKKPAGEGTPDTQAKYLHHLRPAPGSNKPKTRVGRGEGSKGKTSGRGTKGTKARYQVPLGFEGGQMPLHMRLPKLRGFKNPFSEVYQVVNLARLSESFPKGGKISVEDLVDKGLVRRGEKVKVLGSGDVTVQFDLTVDAWSESAKTKVEAQGGSLTAR